MRTTEMTWKGEENAGKNYDCVMFTVSCCCLKVIIMCNEWSISHAEQTAWNSDPKMVHSIRMALLNLQCLLFSIFVTSVQLENFFIWFAIVLFATLLTVFFVCSYRSVLFHTHADFIREKTKSRSHFSAASL